MALAHSGIMVEGVTEPAELAGETESDGEEGVAPEGPLDPQRVYSKNRRLIRSAWEGSQKEIWTDRATLHFLREGSISARDGASHRTRRVLRRAAQYRVVREGNEFQLLRVMANGDTPEWYHRLMPGKE